MLAAQAACGNRAVGELLGRPLEGGLRERLEAALGADFGDVRLHVEAESPQVLGAPAVTRGHHVLLARGEHAPDSPGGFRLLLHELAHVVQQRGASRGATGRAPQQAEAEAESAASGGPAPTPGTVAAGTVQAAPPQLGRRGYYGPPVPPPLRLLPEPPSPVPAPSPGGQGPAPEPGPAAAPEPTSPYAPSPAEEAEPEPSALAKVSEYAAVAGSTLVGHRQVREMLAERPAREAVALAEALATRSRSPREVADALDAADDPERLAAALLRSPLLSSNRALHDLARTPDGRHLLDRLHARLVAGTTGVLGSFLHGMSPVPLIDDSDALMRSAKRVMTARLSAVPDERLSEAAAQTEQLQTLPFQTVNFTSTAQSPLTSWITPQGKVRVELTAGTPGSYRDEVSTLRNKVDALHYDFDPDEIVQVRRYDAGGRTELMPARALLHLHEEYRRHSMERLQLTAAVGMAIGGKSPAPATKVGKVLRWADRTALALAVAAPIVDENRAWLQEHELGGAVEAFDRVNSLSQWYGFARLAQSAPEFVVNLRKRHAELKKVRSSLDPTLPPERKAALDAIEKHFAELSEPTARDAAQGEAAPKEFAPSREGGATAQEPVPPMAAPQDSVPAEPAPQRTAPPDSVPVEPAPQGSLLAEAAPHGPVPAEPTPQQASSQEPVPAEPTPQQAATQEPAPSKPLPRSAASSGVAPVEPPPHQKRSGPSRGPTGDGTPVNVAAPDETAPLLLAAGEREKPAAVRRAPVRNAPPGTALDPSTASRPARRSAEARPSGPGTEAGDGAGAGTGAVAQSAFQDSVWKRPKPTTDIATGRPWDVPGTATATPEPPAAPAPRAEAPTGAGTEVRAAAGPRPPLLPLRLPGQDPDPQERRAPEPVGSATPMTDPTPGDTRSAPAPDPGVRSPVVEPDLPGPALELGSKEPSPPGPHYREKRSTSVDTSTMKNTSELPGLHDISLERFTSNSASLDATELRKKATDEHAALNTPESAAQLAEATTAFKAAHTRRTKSSEALGAAATRHHYLAENHPDAKEEPLHGPANGNDQFDKVVSHPDGRYTVIEYKGDRRTELGSRRLPDGRRVSQGSREYFLDIVREMKDREEDRALAEKLEKAFADGKLDYVLIKAVSSGGKYVGYTKRSFDLGKPTLP